MNWDVQTTVYTYLVVQCIGACNVALGAALEQAALLCKIMID